MFAGYNIWAILVAAFVVFFVLGGLWYSPKLFGNLWKRAAGMETNCEKCHGPQVFILSFVLSLIAALGLAWILGPSPALGHAVVGGFVVGICFVSTSFGINYAFANRGWTLFLIDAGYHTAQFVLYGLILGLWH